jgi:hypothetical protein
MIQTTETDPVETVYDLLEQAASDSQYWTNTPPEVYFYWEIAFQEKSPGADMPPRVYVWSPTSTETPPFSSDGELFDTTATVEIQLWGLDERKLKQLQTDIRQFLSQFFADNAVNTDFSHIFPQNASDYREQKPSRKTQAYVMAIEVELRGLKETALAN